MVSYDYMVQDSLEGLLFVENGKKKHHSGSNREGPGVPGSVPVVPAFQNGCRPREREFSSLPSLLPDFFNFYPFSPLRVFFLRTTFLV